MYRTETFPLYQAALGTRVTAGIWGLVEVLRRDNGSIVVRQAGTSFALNPNVLVTR